MCLCTSTFTKKILIYEKKITKHLLINPKLQFSWLHVMAKNILINKFYQSSNKLFLQNQYI